MWAASEAQEQAACPQPVPGSGVGTHDGPSAMQPGQEGAASLVLQQQPDDSAKKEPGGPTLIRLLLAVHQAPVMLEPMWWAFIALLPLVEHASALSSFAEPFAYPVMERHSRAPQQ